MLICCDTGTAYCMLLFGGGIAATASGCIFTREMGYV